MMGKYLFPLLELFYFLFYHNSINSQTYKVTGRVLTDSHYVSYAAVVLYNSLTNSVVDSVITDSLGYYRLSAVVDVDDNVPTLPTNFELAQNYPNPFSNQTEILYKLNKQNEVTIKIYDILGREIKTFRQGEQNIGIHGVRWDGRNNHGIKAVPGIYFYQLITKKEIQTMKMVYSPSGGSFVKNTNGFISSNSKPRLASNTNSTWNRYTFEIKSIESTKPKIATQRYNDIEIQSDTTINFVVEPINYLSTFGIYFLKDTTKTMSDIMNVDIATLELQEEPWLSGYDIEFYDWSSHCIYLKKDKSYFFRDFANLSFERFYQEWNGRSFIIMAGEKRCYIGYFLASLSNNFWPYPDMFDFDIKYYSLDIIYIEWPYPFAIDKRNNEDIKKLLSSQNLLHNGLNITIDSLWINNADTASIKYRITIKNLDSENLYVLDPDKMGTELFHYFTNGPIFYNTTTQQVYESIYKKIIKPEPTDFYDYNWFSKIESGRTITRDITLKGYPHLLEGNYHCNFVFNNPYNIKKNDRALPDGRFWIGSTRSEMISFDLVGSRKLIPFKLSY